MGRVFVVTLEGEVYSCKFCGTHLALSEDIVLKPYKCRHAYLFDKVVNVTVGEREERQMTAGAHTIVDIFCAECGSIVGWKYEIAHEKSQKYKEGKFLLKEYKISGPDGSNYLHHSNGVEDEENCADVPPSDIHIGEGSSTPADETNVRRASMLSEMTRMESLEARITRLETLVHSLNANVNSINANVAMMQQRGVEFPPPPPQ